jgi:hypothetical protein
MHRLSRTAFLPAVLTVVISLLCASATTAQTRLSDTKKYRCSLNSAVSKSSIRKTSQEKEAKTLATNFEKSINALYQHFKPTKRSDPYIQNTLGYANQLEKLQSSVAPRS